MALFLDLLVVWLGTAGIVAGSAWLCAVRLPDTKTKLEFMSLPLLCWIGLLWPVYVVVFLISLCYLLTDASKVIVAKLVRPADRTAGPLHVPDTIEAVKALADAAIPLCQSLTQTSDKARAEMEAVFAEWKLLNADARQAMADIQRDIAEIHARFGG